MNAENQKEFFQKIALDDNGNVIMVIVPKVLPLEKGDNQYNTFKKLQLTPEGYLKIYEA